MQAADGYVAPELAPANATRPVSATRMATALTGFAASAIAIVALKRPGLPLHEKTLLVVFITAAAMILVDLALFRTSANPSAGMALRPANAWNVERIVSKLIGFWATLGAVAAAYLVFPEYHGNFYAEASAAVRLMLPWLALISPVYVAYVDRRQMEPDDIYAELGRFLTLRGPLPQRDLLGQHVRGWLVKGFFLPLMFVYLAGALHDIWAVDVAKLSTSFSAFFEASYSGFFLFDLLFAVVGYTFTFRLLDTHIRSAEPTAVGWVVCLVCYQPFWSIVGQNYLRYEQDNFYWGGLTSGHEAIYLVWGSLILIAAAIYAWATVSFGLRFSNLTHRGIITSGPYRWTKHPAYVFKCISFWLVSIPFLSNEGLGAALSQSVLLILANAIYVARAYTEEKHLSRDPVYREYQQFIRQHGAVARFIKLMTPQRQ
ncbi:MAG: isoprenylcysteine carboxylmethyltransferase family protein [Bauldia sp.]